MTRVRPDPKQLEENKKLTRIKELEHAIQQREADIDEYHKGKGCLFAVSLCANNAIHRQYELLKRDCDELASLTLASGKHT